MEGPGKWKRQMRSDCGGNSGQMERKVGGMDVCTMECLQGTDAFAIYAPRKRSRHMEKENGRSRKMENGRSRKMEQTMFAQWDVCKGLMPLPVMPTARR